MHGRKNIKKRNGYLYVSAALPRGKTPVLTEWGAA